MRGRDWLAVAIGVLAWSALAQADNEPLPTVGAEGRYYQDSDSNRRHDEVLEAAIPFGAFAAIVETESRTSHDPKGDASSQQALLGIDARVFSSCSLRLRAGLDLFGGEAKPAGDLVLKRKGKWGEWTVRGEYAPLSETAQIIRNRILFGGVELDGKASLYPRFTPGLKLTLRDYSDNNDSVKLRGDFPLAILLEPVRWEIGYREEYATFRRQSGSGYFDPGELNSFQCVTSLSYWTESFEAYGEIFGGLQQTRRYGNNGSNGFFGFYVEASLRKVGPFDVAITAEGGDYSLSSVGGFRHMQAGLRLIYDR